jgi:hypothetical protein
MSLNGIIRKNLDLFLLGHQSFASFDIENAVSKVISQTFGHLVEALP